MQAGSTPIEGLSTSVNYYVRKIDNNSFSLSEVGTGALTNAKYYYENDIVTDLKGQGDGNFNYQPITVSVEGVTGITTRSGQDFQCKIQPVFRGHIDSVDLTAEGTDYGSSEILNFNRQPEFVFEGGELNQQHQLLVMVKSLTSSLQIQVMVTFHHLISQSLVLVNLQNLHQFLKMVDCQKLSLSVQVLTMLR